MGGLINLALTVKRNCLKQQCHPKLSSPGCKFEFEGGGRKKEKENHESLHVVPYCATCHTDIFTITISILCIPTLLAQMDLFKKTISHHAEENNGKKTRDENSPSARIN